jgi:adenylate cyclase
MKRRWPTDNPEALGSLWSGLEYFVRRTKGGNVQARERFERAIALDLQYAAAYAFLGLTYLTEWASHWSQDPQTLEQAFALTQKAIALDDSLPWIHSVLGHVYVWKKQHAQAIAEAERAVALDPTDVDGYGRLAEVLNFTGQPERALGVAEKALRLNPTYPIFYLFEIGWACQLLGRHEEAIATLKKVVSHAPDHLGAHLNLAISYSEVGREAEARAAAAEVLRINPDYSLEVERQRVPFKDPAVAERLFAALRKAGLQ